jgi:accessory gene regulator protein AgrB
MWKKFKDQILTDLKIISLNYSLLIFPGVLFLLIIIILACLPVVTHYEYLRLGLQPTKFHSLVSISLVALIPVFTGIMFGRIESVETYAPSFDGLKKFAENVPAATFIRAITCLVISFLLIILSIWLIKPVPAQGWLRTISAAVLFSFQAPTTMLMHTKSGSRNDDKNKYILLYWITIIMLPVGLMLHHPLNYPAFISPFYWSAWAWMISSPLQSILCGVIALFITTVLCFSVVPKRRESGIK